MADPLSIAASAVTLVQLCTYVAKSTYKFAQETKHIEESVGVLGEEIEALKKILVGIAQTFSNPIIATNLESGVGKQHFLHVKMSLEDCKSTLERLDQIVQQVDAIDGRFFRLVKKRLKMYSKSEEIRSLQKRVEFIRKTMNISLQMITWYVIIEIVCLPQFLRSCERKSQRKCLCETRRVEAHNQPTLADHS